MYVLIWKCHLFVLSEARADLGKNEIDKEVVQKVRSICLPASCTLSGFLVACLVSDLVIVFVQILISFTQVASFFLNITGLKVAGDLGKSYLVSYHQRKGQE